jgi:hypothetical protein
MHYAYPVVLALHALATVFWAGASFALARTGGAQADALFRPMMGAAGVAILTGGYLFSIIGSGIFGHMQLALTIGGLCAVSAAALQAATLSNRADPRYRGGGGGPRAGHPAAVRIAAGLLAVTTVSMVVARHL